MTTIGELLKNERLRRGMSQRDVARMLEVDFSLICRYERNDRIPPVGDTRKFANFLNRDLRELLKLRNEQDTLVKLEAWSTDEIEDQAASDRAEFTDGAGLLDLPRDRDWIAKQITGLNVDYTPYLSKTGTFGTGNPLVYAGLFLQPNGSGEIVVATKRVRGRNDDNVSERTKTFHLFHEVGHFQLHRGLQGRSRQVVTQGRPVFCSSGDNNMIEQQANRYASSFLMPKTIIRNALDGRSLAKYNDIQELSRLFFVETWMVENRLKALRIQIQ